MRISSALPAAFGVVAAGQHAFSVYNDLLAYPQYSVVYSEAFIAASEARDRLRGEAGPRADGQAKTTDLSIGQDGSTSTQKGDRDSYERVLFNSKPYLCTIPYVAPLATPANSTAERTQEEHQSELERATSTGLALLKGMPDCIYYALGWWTYSFCYGQGVKQFHRLPAGGNIPQYPPREDPSVYSFMLGRFAPSQEKGENKYVDGEARAQQQQPLADSAGQGSSSAAKSVSLELKSHGEANYLVQRLEGGTVCDLTGKPRTVTVQFHCNEGMIDHIHVIKEVATCVYLMEVHTPRLCEDVAFMPPQPDRPNVIACQEIVERDKEREWKAAKAKEAFPGKLKTKSELLAVPIVVGGIELGGKKLVGADTAHTIAHDARVGAVAASYRGDELAFGGMSDSQIKKLGVDADPKHIKKLSGDMEKWAGEGKPWRLELVEVDDEFEFRGVQGDQDEEAEPEAGTAARKDDSGARKGEKGSKEEYKGS